MILYFSATGNSRWVAEQIAEVTHDEIFNLSVCCLKRGVVPESVKNAVVLGVVFPVHGWYAPHVVANFLSKLKLSACEYRYAVCTCGDDVGKGMNRLSGHFPLNAAWSVTMPNTYIPMFNLDTAELCHQKISNALCAVRSIGRDVLLRRNVWQVHEGSAAWLKTYIVNPLFARFIICSTGFHVDEGCISCGICSKACPVENIKMVDGNPVWGEDCIHCMACVHACSQKVVQYRKTTQRKGRYRLADYL